MTADHKRFVILRHDHPFLHWDFLLERDEQLESWRLLREPVMEEWIRAEKLPDHRSVYLTYEGPVSGDRGTVRRILSGLHQASSSGRRQLRCHHPITTLVMHQSLQLNVDSGSLFPKSTVAHLVETSDGRSFWIFRCQDDTPV